MLAAISRALDKVNIFFLSLMIATLLGTQSFASFSIAMSYALISFAIIELGGQQLYTYYNGNIERVSPSFLNQLKTLLFILLLPSLIFIDAWPLVILISLGYLFESLSNSYRFQLFQFDYHSREAKIYLAERLIVFLAILSTYSLNYLSVTVNLELMTIFSFICCIKIIFFAINSFFARRLDDVVTPRSFNRYVNFVLHGKYFIFSAFIAALFMQVDILLFSWLNASEQEIALISAMVRLVTATFFIATVFQQFILPKFQYLISDDKNFLKYEKNIGYFAFYITFSFIALSELYLLIFFGDNSMDKILGTVNAELLLLLIFSRFSRDPISTYLGQTGKNKSKLKIMAMLLPLKIMAIYIGYVFYGFYVAIWVIVLFDSCVYFLFRYVTNFKSIDINYWLGGAGLICFSFVVEYVAFPMRMALTVVSLLIAYIYFLKVVKLGTSLK
jgi:hypothetical protein